MNALTTISRLLYKRELEERAANEFRPNLYRAASMPASSMRSRVASSHISRRRASFHQHMTVRDDSALSLSSDEEEVDSDFLRDIQPEHHITQMQDMSLPLRVSVALFVLVKKMLSSVGIKIELPAGLFDLPESTKRHLLLKIPSSGNRTSTTRVPLIKELPPTPTRRKPSVWRRALDRRRSSAASEEVEESKTSIATTATDETPLTSSSRRSSFSLFSKSKSSTPTSNSDKRSRQHSGPVLKPKTLILDLDETLIHSTNRIGGLANVSHSRWGSTLSVKLVEVVMDGKSSVYHVYKRPWVDLFLNKVSAWYTIIIFTASLQEYADPVIDWLDQGRGLISGRFFRESCIFYRGTYYKDLTSIDGDLSSICLVDNSPSSYVRNPANGIPIEGWVGDSSDECLLDLLPLLDSLRFTTDVRRVLGIRGFGASASMQIIPS